MMWGMAIDDANDNAGVPGECPEHEWKVHGIYLRGTGASMSVECKWCGAIQYEPSLSDGT
ncbi:3-oxoacyl-ACP reductase [Arthrobacter sp. AQ5-05]|nr:3-oxoacyl-ACP reductase [Arthrobacter sp. AQ5-05]